VSQQADKLQPGLTSVAREQLDEIFEAGGFDDKQDAYRLAVAVALAEDLEPADAAASRTTYVNIGGLDPDGSLRSAVLAIRDDHDGRPVAFIERLAETGVARIQKHLDDGKSLRELLAIYEPPTEPAEGA
jgi:hypothetical protein